MCAYFVANKWRSYNTVELVQKHVEGCESKTWAEFWLKEVSAATDTDLCQCITEAMRIGLGPSNCPQLLLGLRRSRQNQAILAQVLEHKEIRKWIENKSIAIDSAKQASSWTHNFIVLFRGSAQAEPQWRLSCSCVLDSDCFIETLLMNEQRCPPDTLYPYDSNGGGVNRFENTDQLVAEIGRILLWSREGASAPSLQQAHSHAGKVLSVKWRRKPRGRRRYQWRRQRSR